MKILVTGGTGFIGSHIVEAYLAAGHQVVVLDAGYTEKPVDPPYGTLCIRKDLNSCDLDQIMEKHQFDVINHHAAQVNVRTSLKDPVDDARHNVLATIRLLQATVMSKHPATKFIFSSSGGAIYGNTKIFPTPEDAPCEPTSPYGLSKYAAEKYIQFFRKTYGIKTAILRYANVYGPRQDPMGEAGVIAIFCDLFQRKDTPTIFGDGAQTRDFVYVKDVARANIAALKDDVDGVFNIGTGKESTINDIAAQIRTLTKSDVETKHASPIPGELNRSVVDISLAKQTLNWSPVTNLETGLDATIKSLNQETTPS